MRLATLISLLLTLAFAPGASAALVTIEPPRGAVEQTFSAEQLGSADIRSRSYTVRDAGGGESRLRVTGYSLRAILRHAWDRPAGFESVEIARPDGSTLVLSRSQAVDPSAFPDGPPVVYEEGGKLRFLRPSGGESDRNGADVFEGSEVRIKMRTEALLQVRAAASKRKADVGEAVAFTGSSDGDGVELEWDFGGGDTAKGGKARHSFERAGRQTVVLRARKEGSVLASASVDVRVGNAPAEEEEEPTALSSPSAGTGTGGGSAAGTGSSAGGSPAPKPADPVKPQTAPAPKPKPPGKRVVGTLLDAAATSAPAAAKSAPAATATAPLEAGGVRIPGWVLMALGLIAPLALGVWLERRGGAGRIATQ